MRSTHRPSVQGPKVLATRVGARCTTSSADVLHELRRLPYSASNETGKVTLRVNQVLLPSKGRCQIHSELFQFDLTTLHELPLDNALILEFASDVIVHNVCACVAIVRICSFKYTSTTHNYMPLPD